MSRRVPARRYPSGRFSHDPARRRQALRANPGPDPVQPVRTGLDGFSDHSKLSAQHVFQVALPVPGLSAAHGARCSTERSAAMARDASLLTAPTVIPIVVAICCSDRLP
jgi:hypothetical protein